jgi:hypothetical protein
MGAELYFLKQLIGSCGCATKSLIGELRAALEKSPNLTGAEVLDIIEKVGG